MEEKPYVNRAEIESNFEKIYSNFRMNIYKHIFALLGEREGSITVTEFFAVETIGLLNEPTVTEFAQALAITSSLAAYKVRQLVQKGYVEKVSTEDKRTYRLRATEKYKKYYHEQNSYGKYVFSLIEKTLSADELNATGRLFEKFVKTIESNPKGDNKND